MRHALPPEALDAFLTGVRYHFWHSLGLLLLAALAPQLPQQARRQVGWMFVVGTVCFSGSIYFLATRSLWLPEGLGWLGPVTPLGGVLIAGWGRLAVAGAATRD